VQAGPSAALPPALNAPLEIIPEPLSPLASSGGIDAGTCHCALHEVAGGLAYHAGRKIGRQVIPEFIISQGMIGMKHYSTGARATVIKTWLGHAGEGVGLAMHRNPAERSSTGPKTVAPHPQIASGFPSAITRHMAHV
jgi:hypothetical protein